MIKINKKKVEQVKIIDLFIWIAILILFLYDLFFNRIEIKIIWWIIIFLASFSILLKIFFMVYDKK